MLTMSSMTPNAELTGRQSAPREGDPEAQLLGGPVERLARPPHDRHLICPLGVLTLRQCVSMASADDQRPPTSSSTDFRRSWIASQVESGTAQYCASFARLASNSSF